ncbi:hypothetical protein [Uliginosibacterium sediminicola]|uniref:Lipoprotein n=1 Tax=Uliginosibacterium sediminicola TaxID=2024550 RepID=A0ABU9YWR0_9RHOO
MKRACLIPLFLLLSACENNGASYMIGGSKDHSISLLREQKLIWSDEVGQKVVVARFPQCQHRFDIAPGRTGKAALELYQANEMLFVLHQGKQWWAVGTEDCDLQAFKTPPADPGILLGSFQNKEDALVFVEQK